ncbi:dynein light chain roadblock-type 1 [Cyclospora cayetanensis]|uniref:Dynein light chain cytoplasmic n=2 Tax=Cyclospora cayetanensis TaxID=88456 RepID=A0A1D3D2U9_9EIME|nr:dynein light chain roadblock-type 1 [Cyclospora cayetanensis]OEH77779.1 dynein light chain cytoplasmic [Cyclospora cayetanensis]
MTSSQSEVDDVLRVWLASNPSVVGYVVINTDGIPIRHHEKLSRERAVHYTALLTSFCAKARQCMRELFTTDGELTTVRLRTKEGLEFITCQLISGYALIAIQNCTEKPYDNGDASQSAAPEGQEA